MHQGQDSRQNVVCILSILDAEEYRRRENCKHDAEIKKGDLEHAPVHEDCPRPFVYGSPVLRACSEVLVAESSETSRSRIL